MPTVLRYAVASGPSLTTAGTTRDTPATSDTVRKSQGRQGRASAGTAQTEAVATEQTRGYDDEEESASPLDTCTQQVPLDLTEAGENCNFSPHCDQPNPGLRR